MVLGRPNERRPQRAQGWGKAWLFDMVKHDQGSAAGWRPGLTQVGGTLLGGDPL